MQNYLSNKSYLAIGKQTAQGTVIKPNIFVPMIDADFKTDPKPTRVKQIVGVNYASNKVLQGLRDHSGTIKLQLDPDNLGFLLDIMALKGTTTGDGTVGYTTSFDILNDGAFFTFELLKGNAVTRFMDVKIKKLEIALADGYLEGTLTIVAGGAFNTATLASALSSSVTNIPFDILYDLFPANCLVATDVIQIWHAGTPIDVTVSTIASDMRSANCSSTAVTASKGDMISLKPQTPSFPTLMKPFKFGRMLVGFGATVAAAASAAGAYSTATPLDDLKLTIDKAELLIYASGKDDPIVLPGVPDGEMLIKKLFTNAAEAQAYQDIAKQCCVIVVTGDEVSAGHPASLTLTFYDLKVKTHDNKIKKDEYVYDETTFTLEYSNADAKVMDITIVNSTPGASL